jgi:signal transduction histidine kinase
VSSWTLRRRLRVAFVGATVLAIIAMVVGVVAVANLLGAREELIDRIDLAAVTERDALAAMIDQETGVRGFTLTGDETFLQPYVDGTTAAAAAAEELRALVGSSGRLSELLDDGVAAATVWREDFAEPEIARVRLSGPGEPSEAVQLVGRERFDDVRDSLRALQDELNARRADARDDLNRATAVLLGALVAIVLVVFIVGIVAWVAFSRWTLGPLSRLAAGTRAVAAGDLQLALQPDGPPEIASLGRDVEAMRQRINDEVAVLEAARSELDERARDLARSNADLEQFAYVASHDLQEPLRKVTSFCQLLQRRYAGQLDERADQYIEFAVDGARRMQVLINDLLAFSRVGRSTDGFATVDVGPIVRRAVTDLDEPIDTAEARIDIGPMPMLDADPTLLVMLFRNLVGNAVKFRGERPPVVEISATEDEDGWTFAVADNGIGIDPEYADKVFVIFQRLHPRDRYEGTGIGLALAKKIVEFHGGTIWIDPDTTTGTTIRFTIPRTQQPSTTWSTP